MTINGILSVLPLGVAVVGWIYQMMSDSIQCRPCRRTYSIRLNSIRYLLDTHIFRILERENC